MNTKLVTKLDDLEIQQELDIALLHLTTAPTPPLRREARDYMKALKAEEARRTRAAA